MKVLIFIGLKILEFSALAIFIEGSYRFWGYMSLHYNVVSDWSEREVWVQYFMAILLSTLAVMVLMLLVSLSYMLIRKNWEWANRLGEDQ